ncbi:oligopeptide/dipeptide ABC transporter ATP-binding protein [Chloroflexota bacterium]
MLLSATLPFHPDSQREEIPILGEVLSPLNPPLGCRFHPRCPSAKAICSEVEPPPTHANSGHQVACHLYT